MKTKSSKPNKQRKAQANKPLHQRKKGLVAHLDKKAKEKYKIKKISLRKGDEVEIKKGKHKGKKGKIVKVDLSREVVYIEKITRKKTNKEEVLIPFKASNLRIIELEISDAKRLKKIKGEKDGKKRSKQKAEKNK